MVLIIHLIIRVYILIFRFDGPQGQYWRMFVSCFKTYQKIIKHIFSFPEKIPQNQGDRNVRSNCMMGIFPVSEYCQKSQISLKMSLTIMLDGVSYRKTKKKDPAGVAVGAPC